MTHSDEKKKKRLCNDALKVQCTHAVGWRIGVNGVAGVGGGFWFDAGRAE